MILRLRYAKKTDVDNLTRTVVNLPSTIDALFTAADARLESIGNDGPNRVSVLRPFASDCFGSEGSFLTGC